MADQRPGFRFRLPWLIPSAAAPSPTPSRPTGDIQIPAQPTATPPVVRPPFRPAGVAPPPPPPPQVQAPPRTESQPSSPSRVGAQTRISSQPASPARVAAQARAASQLPPPPPPQVQAPPRTESQPSSPSRVGAQTRVSSQPASPARVGAQTRAASQPQSPTLAAPQPQPQAPSPTRAVPQSRVASQPSSPSRTTLQPQPTSQTASQPRSPSHLGTQPPPATSSLPSSPSITKLQPRTEPVAQPPSPPKTVQPTTQITTEPPPPISEKDAKPVLSQLPLISAEPPPPGKEPTKPIVPQPQTPEAQPKKQDSSTNGADLKPLRKSDGKPEETKDEEEVQKTTVEPKRKTVIELLTEASSHLKAKTKGHPTVASQDQEKQLEYLETKEKVPISSSSEKQPKHLISDPKEKNLVNESRQTPAISNGQRVPLHKEIRDDISKFVNRMTIGHTKHNMEEKPVSVITIAGENRGAFMHLGSDSSSKRERSVHIHRGYKLTPDESTEATTDGEESSKGKRKAKEANTKEEEAKKSYINSNAQGINNSIVFNSSITERNPGVNVVLSHNKKEPINSNHRTESLSRAEINITPSQKLTYEPTVRRRCLRGLFMEPSDSDTDNPEKPRRHGCLYACGAKINDDNIDVL